MLTTSLLFITIALSPVESYNQGNKCYAKGDYPGAITAYTQALDGATGPEVRYNLGNAFFKNGQVGRAVVEYQRARFMDPRDNDVQANLRFVRSYRVDKTLSVPGPIEALMDRLFHLLSQREALQVAALCFLLSSLLASLFIVLRRWLILAAAIPLFLAFAFGAVTAGVWHGYVKSRPAVIVASEVSALSGPGEDYKQILLVHDGTEIVIREARGDWLLAQLPGGAGGWLKRENIEPIFP